MALSGRAFLSCCCWVASLLLLSLPTYVAGSEFRLGTFALDVTIPLGHRCMGTLPTKSARIADSLEAHGFVLLGPMEPIVLCAVDWCEIRNAAYDDFRDAIARAAGTTRQRVLLSALHQHDAPVVDRRAGELLAEVGLPGELYDQVFFADVLRRTAIVVAASVSEAQPVTHVGVGMAKVIGVASNRRVVAANGQVSFDRGSRSGAEPIYAQAPDGLIDPYLRTISLWHDDTPLAAVHAYATHPMSHYGQGEVSSDFVGLARKLRQRDDLSIKQIYVSGCSGDVTAGKYNDGSPAQRQVLAERLLAAMRLAWDDQQRTELREIRFRSAPLTLEWHPKAGLSRESLRAGLEDVSLPVEKRIWHAMGLASRERVDAAQSIDVPCVDLGAAQLVLCPGESFVGYQLMAQEIRPDRFVMAIGYGECWPGYVPTDAAFADQFDDTWLWVARGSEARLRASLEHVLRP